MPKNGKKRGNRPRRSVIPSGPKTYTTSIGVRNYTIRYRVTSALEGTFNLLVMARTFFQVFATNTTVVSLCQAVRFKSFEIWCAGDSDQTNRSVTLGFSPVPGSILNTRLIQKSDTSFSVNDTAHVKLIPPKNSTFSWWFTVEGSSSPGSIQISTQTEAVFDVTFDADFNLPSNAVTPTVPSAVTVSSPTPLPGVIYTGFWDSNMQPQGVLRIA